MDFQQTLAEGVQSGRIPTIEGDYYHLDQFIGEYNQFNRQSKLFRLFDDEVTNLVVSADVTLNPAHIYTEQLYTGCGFIFRNNDDAVVDEPESFMHSQLVTEGKDFFWGLNKGKFVSYGRKYFANPFASKRTFKLTVFANGADVSVLLDGKELRRNKDVAVVTPGMIHYTVQNGNLVDYGMRCTFDNVNLFILGGEEESLAAAAKDDPLLEIPPADSALIPPPEVTVTPENIPPSDSGLLTPPGAVVTPEDVPEGEIPPEDVPGDDGAKEPDKGVTPPSFAPPPPLPGVSPEPGDGGEQGITPTPTPTATPGVTLAPPIIVSVTPTPSQMSTSFVIWSPQPPTPTIVYPPYDENWEPLERDCPKEMKKAMKWGVAMDISICREPKVALPENYQKEVDAYCSIMYEFRQQCDDGIPYYFHKYCINLELDLQKRGLHPPVGSEFFKKFKDLGHFDTMLNQAYAACTWDNSYTDSTCRRYLLYPPQNPSNYQKDILYFCRTCNKYTDLKKCNNPIAWTPPDCTDIGMRCGNNLDYMICKNIDRLKQAKGADLKEIGRIEAYCKQYGLSGSPMKWMMGTGNPPPDDGSSEDGTKKRPETSPLKPPAEEEEVVPGAPPRQPVDEYDWWWNFYCPAHPNDPDCPGY